MPDTLNSQEYDLAKPHSSARRSQKPRPTAKLDYARLEPRRVLSVSGSFNSGTGILTIALTDPGDSLVLSESGGQVTINGSNDLDPFSGGMQTADIVDVTEIRIFGDSGDANQNVSLQGDFSSSNAISLEDLIIDNVSSVTIEGTYHFSDDVTIELTDTGDITDEATGELQVADRTTLTTKSGSITLNNSGNDFDGRVSADSLGGDIFLSDADDLLIDDLISSGDASLFAKGSILDLTSSQINVNDTLTLFASDGLVNGNNSILLGESGSDSLISGKITILDGEDVQLTFDSDAVLTGVNVADTLSITVDGTLTDASSTTLTIANKATLDADSILLGDSVSDSYTVPLLSAQALTDIEIANLTGTTTLFGNTTANNISFADFDMLDNVAGATVNANSLVLDGTSAKLGQETSDQIEIDDLTFQLTDSLVLDTDRSVFILGNNQSKILLLSSTDTISNRVAASLDVNDLTSLNAQTIDLGRQTGDSIQVKTLDLTSTGSSILELESGAELDQVTVNSLSLVSNSTITNSVNAAVIVTTTAELEGQAIDLGRASIDFVSFAKLTFNSPGDVSIEADSQLAIIGGNSADNLTLESTGAIFNSGTGSIVATSETSLTGASIDLGNQSGDSIQFTELTFNSPGTVAVSTNTDLKVTDSNSAQSLTLSSTGILEDTSSTTIAVGTDTLLEGSTVSIGGSGGSISTQRIRFGNSDSVELTTTEDIQLFGASNLTSATLTTTKSILNDASTSFIVADHLSLNASAIDLGDQLGDNFESTTLTFSTTGTTEYLQDSAIDLKASNTADSLTLLAAGTISNQASSSLNVSNHANITASSINLGTAVSDSVLLGSVEFNSIGSTTIESSQAIEISGSNSASDLILKTTGTLTNVATTTIDVVNSADLSAASIDLGSETGDQIEFGKLTANSTSDLRIELDLGVVLNDITVTKDAFISSTGTLSNAASSKVDVGQHTELVGSSISVGQETNDWFETGSLNFSSTGDVTISAESDLVLSGVNSASNISLDSLGDLKGQTSSSISTPGTLELSGTNIQFDASTSSHIDSNFLTIQTAGSAKLDHVGDVIFTNASTASDLILETTGQIVNFAGATVDVNGLAQFKASNIDLGQQASDSITIEELNFETTNGAVFILDEAVVLSGASSSATLTLESTGSINQADSSSLAVTGEAKISGSNFELGIATGSSFDSSQLQFQSAGNVSISSENALHLTGVNSANELSLVSGGDITDGDNTTLNVNKAAYFEALGDITLGDHVGDILNFGSVGASAGHITLTESSSTHLDGMSALSLTLNNTGHVTQSGIDTGAGFGQLQIDGNLAISTTSGSDVHLLRTSSLGGLFSDGTVQDNVIDGIATFNGAEATLRFRNLSTSVNGGVQLGATYDNLELSLPNTGFEFSSINVFNELNVSVGSDLTDAAFSVIDVGDATFSASNITFAESLGEVLIVGGLATFEGALNIDVGDGGFFVADAVNFSTFGIVNIDASGPLEIRGDNTGTIVTLTVDGSLTDADFSSILVAGRLEVEADSVSLGAGVGQSVTVSTVQVQSTGAVVLHADSDLEFVGSNTMDSLSLSAENVTSNAASIFVTNNLQFSGISLSLGNSSGDLLFANTYTFTNAEIVNINALSNIVVTGSNIVDNLYLATIGNITGDTGSALSVHGDLTLEAGFGSGDVDFGQAGFNLFTDHPFGATDRALSIWAGNAVVSSFGNLTLGDIEVFDTLYLRTTGIPDGPGGRFPQGDIYQLQGTSIFASNGGFDATGSIQLLNASFFTAAYSSKSDGLLLPGVTGSEFNSVFDTSLLGDRFGIIVQGIGDTQIGQVGDSFGHGYSVEGALAEQGHIYLETKFIGSMTVTADVRVADSSQTITAIAATALDIDLNAQFQRGNEASISKNFIPLSVNEIGSGADFLTVDLLEGIQKLSLNFGIAGDGNYSVKVTWADGSVDSLSASQLNALTSNPSDPGNANPTGESAIVIAKSTPYSTQTLFELFELTSIVQVFSDPGIRLFELAGASDLNVASLQFEAFVGRDQLTIPNRETEASFSVHVRDVAETDGEQYSTNSSAERSEYEVSSGLQNEENQSLYSVHISPDGEENRIDWSGQFSINEVEQIKQKIMEDGLATVGEYSIRRTTADGSTIELLNFQKTFVAEEADSLASQQPSESGDQDNPTTTNPSEPKLQWVSAESRDLFLSAVSQPQGLTENAPLDEPADPNSPAKAPADSRFEQDGQQQHVAPSDPNADSASHDAKSKLEPAQASLFGIGLLMLAKKRRAQSESGRASQTIHRDSGPQLVADLGGSEFTKRARLGRRRMAH